MAVTYDPHDAILINDLSMSGNGFEIILRQLKKSNSINPEFIRYSIDYNNRIAELIDSISGLEAFELLEEILKYI